MKPKVLNRRRNLKSTGVYVGRPTKWGNPFVIGVHGTREEVVALYREYILNSRLKDELHELTGRNLICWCAPLACHADVLLELSNKE